jgi:glutamate--cysteine ligase catalytic subunit
MRLRRKRLLSVLRDDEICPTLTVFPLLGVGSFTDPELPAGVRIAQALMASSHTIRPWMLCRRKCPMLSVPKR